MFISRFSMKAVGCLFLLFTSMVGFASHSGSFNSDLNAQKIVIPTRLAASPGSGAQAPFRGDQLRYQNIYNSGDFQAATSEQIIITRLSFRLDESLGSSLSVTVPDLEIRMGTASSGKPASTLDYQENIGRDYKTVFRGSWQHPEVASGGRVNPFSITVPVDAFYYDPKEGGLVVDLFVYVGGGGSLLDADGSGESGFAIRGPLSATVGSGIAPLLVAEFEYQAVPEPSAMSIGALVALIFFAKGKRTA